VENDIDKQIRGIVSGVVEQVVSTKKEPPAAAGSQSQARPSHDIKPGMSPEEFTRIAEAAVAALNG
jgi:hypothetical protein